MLKNYLKVVEKFGKNVADLRKLKLDVFDIIQNDFIDIHHVYHADFPPKLP